MMLNLSGGNVDELFAMDSHHYSVSIILTLQDYFQNKTTRTIYRSLSYRILFNDTGNQRYLRDISVQILTDASFLKDCFDQLTKWCPSRFNCLLVDSHPIGHIPGFPVRANFLPDTDGKIRPLLFKR